MKNDELVLAYPSLLETGKPFIYGVKATQNDKFIQLEIAQRVKTSLSADADMNSLLLGWGNETILRHWRNVDVTFVTGDALKALQESVGKTVEEAFARAFFAGEVKPVTLLSRQYTKATDPIAYQAAVIAPVLKGRTGASPVVNPKTSMAMLHNGFEIYRDTDMVFGDFDLNKHYSILPADKEVAQTAAPQIIPGVSVEQQLNAEAEAKAKAAVK